MKKRVQQKLQSRDGMTLVELIVTFALLGILMAAAIATLSPAANVFQKVSAMSRGQSVSSILLDKIGSEIETATGNVCISADGVNNTTGEGNWISYMDKQGQEVVIYSAKEPHDSSGSGEKYLQLRYNKTVQLKEGIDWNYSKSTYMNEAIQHLVFQRVGGTNQVRIKLKLYNTRTETTYERTRVVECFKLDASGFISDGLFPGIK